MKNKIVIKYDNGSVRAMDLGGRRDRDKGYEGTMNYLNLQITINNKDRSKS